MFDVIPILPEFDPREIEPHARIAIVGKACTGKTTMMTDLVFHQREKLDFCLQFSHESCGPFGERLIPHSWSRGMAFLPVMKAMKRVGIVTDDCEERASYESSHDVLRIDCMQHLGPLREDMYDLVIFFPCRCHRMDADFWRLFLSLAESRENPNFDGNSFSGPYDALVFDLRRRTMLHYKAQLHDSFTVGDVDKWNQ